MHVTYAGVNTVIILLTFLIAEQAEDVSSVVVTALYRMIFRFPTMKYDEKARMIFLGD